MCSKAIDAAEVDERTVVGEVFDRAGEDNALFEVLESGGTLGVLLFFEDLFAADNHVAALLVELDDADFNLGAEVAIEIADRAHLKLRTGQERLEANVDRETALDAADDGAHHRGLVVGCLLDDVPNAQALSFVVGDKIAALGLFALDDNFDLFASLELGLAVVVNSLLDGEQCPQT